MTWRHLANVPSIYPPSRNALARPHTRNSSRINVTRTIYVRTCPKVSQSPTVHVAHSLPYMTDRALLGLFAHSRPARLSCVVYIHPSIQPVIHRVLYQLSLPSSFSRDSILGFYRRPLDLPRFFGPLPLRLFLALLLFFLMFSTTILLMHTSSPIGVAIASIAGPVYVGEVVVGACSA